MLRRELDELTGHIVAAGMKVHSVLGPGLLEGAYEECLVYELRKRGLTVQAQMPLPITYENIRIDAGYRVDLLVEDAVIVELKAVVKLMPIHEAQLLSYLRLSNRRVGLLMNFHVLHLRDGIVRMVNRF